MKTLFLKLSLATWALTLTACGGSLIPEDSNTEEKAHAIGLEAHKQQVRRYDCNNNLVSDKIEVVKPATKFMQIPQTKGGAITHSDIRNVRTDSAPAVVNGTSFTIDTSPGFLNMHVARGINEIQYTYKFHNGDSEVGKRFIDVTYSEVTLPGVSEVRPTPQYCNPTPTPTPAP